MSDMIRVLMRAEQALPKLLHEPGWNSVDVNYHPPRVARLWRPFENCRLFLHCIHPCESDQALLHPHPWPSAMRILRGTYRMRVGSSPGLEAPPVVLESVVEATPAAEYRYVMEHPDGWHAVCPVGNPVYSVMVTGQPWQRAIPEVTTESKGRLPELDEKSQRSMLAMFRHWYPAQ